MKGKYAVVILALLIALTGTAFAESVRFDGETGALTVAWENCREGSSCSFMAVSGSEDAYSISGSSLLFASQPTADENGRVSVTFIGTDLTKCVFLTGGEFTDGSESPRLIGSFVPPRTEKVEFRLPAALTVIDEEAFMGSDLDYVYIGSNVTEIGPRAFGNCVRMRYIHIPENVAVIGEDAFSGCSQLVIGCAKGSAAHTYAVENSIAFEFVGE